MLVLKLWVRLVLIGGGPAWCAAWRSKFQRVQDEGFNNFDGLRVLITIVSPLLVQLLLMLCGPYVLVKVSVNSVTRVRARVRVRQ